LATETAQVDSGRGHYPQAAFASCRLPFHLMILLADTAVRQEADIPWIPRNLMGRWYSDEQTDGAEV
jgi:hypothetical protein